MGCTCSESRRPSVSIQENLMKVNHQTTQQDSKQQTARTSHPSPRLSDRPIKRRHFSILKSQSAQITTVANDFQMASQQMRSFDESNYNRSVLGQIVQVNRHPEQSEYSHNMTLNSKRSSQASVVSSECGPKERHLTQQNTGRDSVNRTTSMGWYV